VHQDSLEKLVKNRVQLVDLGPTVSSCVNVPIMRNAVQLLEGVRVMMDSLEKTVTNHVMREDLATTANTSASVVMAAHVVTWTDLVRASLALLENIARLDSSKQATWNEHKKKNCEPIRRD